MQTRTKILYRLCQCTWGGVQTLVGLVLFLVFLRCPHYRYRGAVLTEWKSGNGLSLGFFIFIPAAAGERDGFARRLVMHEYGHTVQSLILGPLYLLLIGLPSFFWAALPVFAKLRRERGVSYYSLYTEKWADQLGAPLIPDEGRPILTLRRTHETK